MNDLVKQFKESISRISDEEFFQIWDELKEFNEIGPIAVEYVEHAQCKLNRNSQNYCCNTTSVKIEGEIVFGENSSFYLAA